MSDDVSISNWSFFNPTKIIYCESFIFEIDKLLNNSKSILLITSPSFSSNGTVKKISNLSGDRKIYIYDQIKPNPKIDEVEQLLFVNKEKKFDAVIALGGGSVIDTAKIFTYIQGSKKNYKLTDLIDTRHSFSDKINIKLFAIPTTAGTGSEVTPFATVWDGLARKKISISGDSLFPYCAILDPFLLETLNYDNLLYPALDTISHSLESLWNKNRTPLSTILAIKSLSLSEKNILNALAGNNQKSKAALLEASTLAGLAISQTKTAIAHSISYPLTINYQVPHGLASSFTLLELLKLNQNLLKSLGVADKTFLNIIFILNSLNFKDMMLKYLEFDQILSLSNEMISKGRFENYIGPLPDGIISLINNSLRQK